MPDRTTTKIFSFIVAAYIALLLPHAFWPGYIETPFGLLAALPIYSVYIFHALGVPGLLQNNGSCGWGWCSPTVFGWAFVAAIWLVLAWLAAKISVSLFMRAK